MYDGLQHEMYGFADKTVQFGGIVSTSNSYACANIEIDCNQYLFWSTATDDEQEDLL